MIISNNIRVIATRSISHLGVYHLPNVTSAWSIPLAIANLALRFNVVRGIASLFANPCPSRNLEMAR